LRRHYFEIIIDHSQTLMLHFNELRRHVDDVVRTFVRRVLNDWRVRYNEFDDRFVNQLCFDKARVSRENDETRKYQRLNNHFFWMFLTCVFHFSLISICIFKTRIWFNDCFTTSQMRTIVCISIFLEFFVKWMSSYLIDAKTISWRRVYVSQWACIFSRTRQLFVMLTSYVNILMLFIKSIATIERNNCFKSFKKSTL
jgi:hypothetical protein